MKKPAAVHSEDIEINHANHALLVADRKEAAGAGLRALAAIDQELAEMVPNIAEFVRQRDHLGEYDASAAAIIEISKIMLRYGEFMRAWVKANIDLELAR